MNLARLPPTSVAILILIGAGCVAKPSQPDAAPVESAATTTTAGSTRRLLMARSTTFRIRSQSACEGVGVGSSFLISGHRLVTARHVVVGASDLEIEGWDGTTVQKVRNRQATWADLAVVDVRTERPVLDLALADPSKGNAVYAYGYPSGHQLTVSSGRVLGYTKDVELGNLGRIMQFSAHIEPGNSGGPLVDARTGGRRRVRNRGREQAMALPFRLAP